MDWTFIKEGLKPIIPFTLIIALVFMLTPPTGDFLFHLNNTGFEDYPQGVAIILNILQPIFLGNRLMALFTLTLLTSAILPCFLITHMVAKTNPTWRWPSAWVYLYGSGVPFILFFTGLIPQAIIQLLMLFAIAEPIIGLLFFALVGGSIHREYALAILLTISYLSFQQFIRPRLPEDWFA